MTAPTDRIKSVDEALTSVIGLLESEATLKKSLREALEPIDDVHRAALAELNKLHSSSAASREFSSFYFVTCPDAPAPAGAAAPSFKPLTSYSNYCLLRAESARVKPSRLPFGNAAICSRTLEIVSTAGPYWQTVASLIPEGEYYRYQFALGPPMRNLTTVVALAHFLLDDSLITCSDAAKTMRLSGTLQLTAEDYLQGVIGMVNELPRLSINSVTAQNFALPTKIASFVNDIFASYSLLNLRNDALRRKFDSLKYDLKRCEDVVYDLTLRGLTGRPAS